MEANDLPPHQSTFNVVSFKYSSFGGESDNKEEQYDKEKAWPALP